MVWVLYASVGLDSLAIAEDSVALLKGKVLLIDVRSHSFFRRAPLGAKYNLPLTDILAGHLPPRGYDYYVAVCSCPRGGIGREAAKILREHGFKAFYVVR